MNVLPPEERLSLLRFVCSFAWADLRVNEAERHFVHGLVRRMRLNETDAELVEGWLKHPPNPEEVDPLLIPAEHRAIFLETALGVMASDGQISPSETETYNLLAELLRGEEEDEGETEQIEIDA
jgi:uncharacterized tellurite resistance protein B-like protein